jgi:DNA polymerase-1
MREPVAVVVTASGVAFADATGTHWETDRAAALRRRDAEDPRWVWWNARETAPALLDAGVSPRACWDLGAVSRVLHGTHRDDPGAGWALLHDLPVPTERGPAEPDLFDAASPTDGPLAADGALHPSWLRGGWAEAPETARAWASLAREAFTLQVAAAAAVPDPRPGAGQPPLAVLTAYAESLAALVAVELEREGLPVDREVAGRIVGAVIGPRPVDDRHAEAQRRHRDDAVLAHFPGSPADLRNPAQVRDLLARIGLDLPDTRSWRLEPHASLPAVAALLDWRKAERMRTTYGWTWLDRDVGDDGRLRGGWSAAEGAGRMSAGAGLHNLPAELRPAVRAEPGHRLVRADLGQVEPRVLAVVSGDTALAAAAREDDMYAPVAAALHCDRPTAKVAVLAAMYGQTTGAAGAALRDMARTYPRALGYLRAAEEAGRTGNNLRTYGGRLLRLERDLGVEQRHPPSAWGRFARNAVVQGAAAELFKAWTGTARSELAPFGGRIVLCLHDELLVHVPAAAADSAAEALHRSLAATARWWAAGSGVRFVAEVTVGESWADAH